MSKCIFPHSDTPTIQFMHIPIQVTVTISTKMKELYLICMVGLVCLLGYGKWIVTFEHEIGNREHGLPAILSINFQSLMT